MIRDSEFKKEIASLTELQRAAPHSESVKAIHRFISALHEGEDYSRIVQLFHSNLCYPREEYYLFEVAFSLNRDGFADEAEIVYEHLLKQEPNNASVLNNLALIKQSKNKLKEAYRLIDTGYKLDPHDQYISTNYKSISSKYQEMLKYQDTYKSCSGYLADENDFVLNKLRLFLSNVDRDPTFKLGKIPIPSWKFSVLMATDKQKTNSLREQWIEKSYIRAIDEKGEYGESIYEINPFLKAELDKITSRRLNDKWIKGIEALSISALNECDYFVIKAKIGKINKKYRALVDRDFDELVFNYILKNEKAVVVLSGSLVEALLMYHCEKKKISSINYQRGNKNIQKKIYDCDLGDLLNYFEESNILGDLIVHLGNISRIHRNYVHPGKELRETETLDEAKARLCFISTTEVIKHII